MTQITYIGKDLEAMAFAQNYHRWIFDELQPYLGKRIIEVGAGTGSFSELLLAHEPNSLFLIEPSEMYKHLVTNIATWKTSTEVHAYRAVFTQVAEAIRAQHALDSIVYINVLEHVHDDSAELDAMYRTLDKNGRIFLFVPALPWLYGRLDRRLGHFRRYIKAVLEGKCQAAGFTILKSRYFDFTGVVPWWIKYKLLRSESFESSLVKLYDGLVVPMSKRIESTMTPPIGKNILLIARK